MIHQAIHIDYLKIVVKVDRQVHEYINNLCSNYLTHTTRFYKYRFHNKALPLMPEAALYILTKEIKDSIVIEFCPPKLFTGKNLSGSLNLMQIRRDAQAIIESYFTKEEQDDPRYQSFRDAYIRHPDGTIYDLTSHIKVDEDKQEHCLNADRTPFNFEGIRLKQYVLPKGEEALPSALIWGIRHKGKGTSCLIYQKQEEVWAKDTADLYTPEEHQFMSEHLRVEFRFRYQAAKELGLRDMTTVNSSLLEKIFKTHLDKLISDTPLNEAIIPNLTLREKELLAYWQDGSLDIWKQQLSAATYYRYKKSLKDKGIDVSKPYGYYLKKQ